MANKIIKWTGIGLLGALALMQLYHPAKNINPNVTGDDITLAYQTPQQVTDILHKACYDCHSNNTSYPWYNNIQPVASFLADHVNEGKEELNFSEFGSFKPKRKLRKLKEIVDEVEEGEMPLSSYTWIHKEAKLTAEEKRLLTDWAKALAQKISTESGVAQQ